MTNYAISLKNCAFPHVACFSGSLSKIAYSMVNVGVVAAVVIDVLAPP